MGSEVPRPSRVIGPARAAVALIAPLRRPVAAALIVPLHPPVVAALIVRLRPTVAAALIAPLHPPAAVTAERARRPLIAPLRPLVADIAQRLRLAAEATSMAEAAEAAVFTAVVEAAAPTAAVVAGKGRCSWFELFRRARLRAERAGLLIPTAGQSEYQSSGISSRWTLL